jgi:outer membrane protein
MFAFGPSIPEFERPTAEKRINFVCNSVWEMELGQVLHGTQVAFHQRVTSSQQERRSSMRLFRNCIAVVAIMLSPALAAAQQQGDRARPISLDEAVRLAQLNSPVTVTARNALRTGRLAEMNALGQYLPSVSVSSYAYNTSGATLFQGQVYPYNGPPWNFGDGVNAGLLLLDGGQRWFGYRAAQANQRSYAENETLQRYGVGLAVKQQYYTVLQARELEAAGASAVEAAQVTLNYASARVKVGAAVRTDSLKAAVQMGTARLALINARASLRDANAALTRLVASNVQVTAIAADTNDVPRLDVDDATLTRMADEGPAVRQAVAAFEASKATRRSTITGTYIPQIRLGYNYGISTTSSYFNWGGGPGSSNTQYTLSASYPIFNNFARELTAMQSAVAEDNAEANLRDARFNARANLATLLDQYRTAIETINLQQLQIAAAQEDLTATQTRYGLGAAAYLDVLTSQTVLDAQRTALINARFTARTAKAAIEAFVGRDLK